MKTRRQAKILELIQRNDVETQEELSAYLVREGFQVTQATVSRDIRELKLTSHGQWKAEIRSDHGCGFRHDGKICQSVARRIHFHGSGKEYCSDQDGLWYGGSCLRGN